jgi:hypothetical protein
MQPIGIRSVIKANVALRFGGVQEDAQAYFNAIPRGRDNALSDYEIAGKLGWDYERRRQAKLAMSAEQNWQLASYTVMWNPDNAKDVLFRHYKP